MTAVRAAAVAPGSEVCNVFFMTHGWNAGEESARALYQHMFRLLASMLGQHLPSTIAVGVFWPARVLSEDDPATAVSVPGVRDGSAPELAKVFPGQQQHLNTVIHAVASGQPVSGAGGVYQQARALVTSDPSPLGSQYDEDAVLVRAKGLLGADIDKFVDHVAGDALDVVRIFTYYEMKNRAGVVGQQGLGPLVSRLGQHVPQVRAHLMGHSFGARLVAHALVGLAQNQGPDDTSPVKSLMLIQGAFSHFAFAPAVTYAPNPGTGGALAHFTAMVDGPLLATPARTGPWASGTRWRPCSSTRTSPCSITRPTAGAQWATTASSRRTPSRPRPCPRAPRTASPRARATALTPTR
ncbi:hypothetical protein [Streptomyces gilvosporeus]|uniref:Serine-threonine protein kinase n=1 Tax=Streptomyces gilvosporeus TaxID=553510 RepID=A0A1V0TYM5_9ACTN|nr:hypothetical protein [Streptomyces gilvosporeus]ARF58085.1 hypothetical protein B1H19_31390 [Streptomyces gilvosporeus]